MSSCNSRWLHGASCKGLVQRRAVKGALVQHGGSCAKALCKAGSCATPSCNGAVTECLVQPCGAKCTLVQRPRATGWPLGEASCNTGPCAMLLVQWCGGAGGLVQHYRVFVQRPRAAADCGICLVQRPCATACATLQRKRSSCARLSCNSVKHT